MGRKKVLAIETTKRKEYGYEMPLKQPREPTPVQGTVPVRQAVRKQEQKRGFISGLFSRRKKTLTPLEEGAAELNDMADRLEK